MSGTSQSNLPRSSGRLTWALFIVVSTVNAALLWHFHDRYWYPTDDGFYANIAERLLSGEILNLDVQDIHPGYIHFLHVAAFRIFGQDVVSLRYPLMLAAFVQACLVYALLQRRDIVLASLGSLSITALGVIQFVDPTPNWYCLTFCVMLACWLFWLPPSNRLRFVGAGFLLGVLTLFRQLSGVWAAMAVLVLVLLELSDRSREPGGWLTPALLVVMLVALVGYLVVSPETEPGGVLLIAAWPIAILGWMLLNVKARNAAVSRAIAHLALGATAAVVPLAIYHIAHGSLASWITDTVLVGFGETQMPFFGRGWYGVLSIAGLYQAISSSGDATKIVNGLYWAALPIVSVVNGVLILNRLRQIKDVQDLALPVLAAFYALVSLYLEGPLYLYYSVGLTVVAVLWLGATGSFLQRVSWATSAAGMILVAVVFHAGQSRIRTAREILEGHRVTDTWARGGEGLARCSLRLDERDHHLYGRLVELIQAETQPDESILALPNDAELYFLANRRNPVRFYNSALGIRTDDDLQHVVSELTAHPPRLVLFRPDDKYNTDASRQIMALVSNQYVHTETIDGLQVYRR